MRKVDEFIVAAQAQQPEFDRLDENITMLQNEMFVETADEYGISRLEKVYGITEKSSDTEFRKFRLMLKIKGGKNKTLAERFDELLGPGNYLMNFYKNEMLLEIKITVESEQYLDEAFKLADRIVPCNIKLDVRIMYASHKMLGKYTHKELSSCRYEELKLKFDN